MRDIEELYNEMYEFFDKESHYSCNPIRKLELSSDGHVVSIYVEGGIELPALVKLSELFGDDSMTIFPTRHNQIEIIVTNNNKAEYHAADYEPHGFKHIMEVNFVDEKEE